MSKNSERSRQMNHHGPVGYLEHDSEVRPIFSWDNYHALLLHGGWSKSSASAYDRYTEKLGNSVIQMLDINSKP